MTADLVVFSEDWGRHPSSTQHIVKHLAKSHTILWVNSMGLRRPRFSIHDSKRLLQKIKDWLATPQNKPSVAKTDGFRVLTPFAIPWPGSTIAQWLNGIIASWQVQRNMKKLGIKNPILLISLPCFASVITRLSAKEKIYFCCDDYSAIAGVDNQAAVRLEQQLLHQVNSIVVVSEILREKFIRFEPSLISQGVDFDLFTKIQPRPIDLPSGKPIVGFCGGIEEWVDLQLIEEMAHCLSEYNIVLIGPIKTDVSQLKQSNNIHLLGAKPYQEVVSYLQHWDVSILPFRMDRKEVTACDPLKIREYLAVGKPVVVTDFPVMHDFKDVVTIANTREKFIRAVKSYCEGEDAVGDFNRRARVKNDDWQNKAEEMRQLFPT